MNWVLDELVRLGMSKGFSELEVLTSVKRSIEVAVHFLPVAESPTPPSTPLPFDDALLLPREPRLKIRKS